MKRVLSFVVVLMVFSYLPALAWRGSGGSLSGGSSEGDHSSGGNSGNGGDNGGSSVNVPPTQNQPSDGVHFNANSSSPRSSGAVRANGNSWNRGSGYFRNSVRTNLARGNARGYQRSWPGYNRNSALNASRFNARMTVPSAWKSVGVKKMPASVLNTQMPDVSREHTSPALPRTGSGGAVLRASAATPRDNPAFVRTSMSTFARNGAFRSEINGLNTSENRVGHYYWHNWNGQNFCHYYDAFGCNWYGWYFGGNCFWSCWYGDYWWWYDPAFSRWCYWDNNYWWWQNPYNVNETDVYDNGQYVSPNQANQPSVSDTITKPLSQGIYASDDGTRRVEVMGDDQDAFLYDTANPPAFKPIYLTSNVKKVTFTNKGKDKALQIVIALNDGKTQRFNDRGQTVGK